VCDHRKEFTVRKPRPGILGTATPERPWGECSLWEAGRRIELAEMRARRAAHQPDVPVLHHVAARPRERRARSTRRTSAAASADDGSSEPPSAGLTPAFRDYIKSKLADFAGLEAVA
jgi:hypothetical protein